MTEKKQAFGVARLSLAPKTTRQKIAVMAGLLLLGYWATDPNSSDSLSVSIAPSESGDSLGEIEIMLSELEGRHTHAAPAADSSTPATTEVAVVGTLAIPTPSAPADSPLALIIPSAEPQAATNVFFNANYSNSADEMVVPVISQPVSQTSSPQPHNEPVAPPVRQAAPTKIRLTGTITPL